VIFIYVELPLHSEPERTIVTNSLASSEQNTLGHRFRHQIPPPIPNLLTSELTATIYIIVYLHLRIQDERTRIPYFFLLVLSKLVSHFSLSPRKSNRTLLVRQRTLGSRSRFSHPYFSGSMFLLARPLTESLRRGYTSMVFKVGTWHSKRFSSLRLFPEAG